MKSLTLIKMAAVLTAVCSFGTSGFAAETETEKGKEKEKGKEAAPAPAAKKVAWQVTGELEEACSCSAPCPCWFKSLPTKKTCDGLQVVVITDGKYGKTPLKGLLLAQYVQSPASQSMFESFGKWNFDMVYIDEKATEEQREALKVLAGHFFPAGAGAEKREYKFVPITRTVEKGEHKTTIGTMGVCSGHLVEGGDGKPPKVTNPPLADPTHREFLQGETTLLTYNDAGQGWEYKESNYMFNKFKVDDKVYAKHEAEMAKKMAEMKKAEGGGGEEKKGEETKEEEKEEK